MEISVPEKHKKPGVCYAVTDDGLELPVIDITHPAFALEMSQAELDGLTEKHFHVARARARTPAFVTKLFLALCRRHSILVRSHMDSRHSFVSALTTYLVKLGPDNLGAGYAGRIDRKFASALPCLSARLRLQDVARLLAEGLGAALAARKQSPVRLLNIGGGAAMDSFNALILLRQSHAQLLAGRKVSVSCLDLEEAGPRFAGRALSALKAAGGPLDGMDIAFEHAVYDWADTAGLRQAIAAFDPTVAAGGSSEGALFDYGSDKDIVSNLDALRNGTPDDFVVAGTITRDSEVLKGGMDAGHLSFRPRKPDAFRELVGLAGWEVVRLIDRPFSHDFLLRKGAVR